LGYQEAKSINFSLPQALSPPPSAGWVFLRVKIGFCKPFFTLKLPKIKPKEREINNYRFLREVLFIVFALKTAIYVSAALQ